MSQMHYICFRSSADGFSGYHFQQSVFRPLKDQTMKKKKKRESPSSSKLLSRTEMSWKSGVRNLQSTPTQSSYSLEARRSVWKCCKWKTSGEELGRPENTRSSSSFFFVFLLFYLSFFCVTQCDKVQVSVKTVAGERRRSREINDQKC